MKKHWNVGYGYRYDVYREWSKIVYGTKKQAKAYLLAELDKQPDWLRNNVNHDFNVKNVSEKVFCNALEIVIL